jgi:cellulose synthase/poly-beta-1,6-N-acetylglucosamine synthase-like glycosyltransferase/peptidoglycan/xylan/chitin deacetylase (PgdA/CDA1 family)
MAPPVRPNRARLTQPRAHWALLSLVLMVMLAELGLAGFVDHVGAEGSGPTAVTGAPGPRSVLDGGPLVRVGPDNDVSTRELTPGTVALTFDDGPDPTWTPQILDVLDKHHVHATFFVIGSKVNQYPALTREILARGNEIGVHTFTHVDMSAAPVWRQRLELSLAENAIAGATGIKATLMRPPYSSEPDAVTAPQYEAMREIGAEGYLIVLTDLDTQDWQQPGTRAIVRNGTPADGEGAVVMLHDGGGDRSQTVDGLDRLLDQLADDGDRVMTVSQAFGLPPAGPAPRTWQLRGDALRWAQTLATLLIDIMTLLLGIALVLSVARLVVQLIVARLHVRRTRRVPKPKATKAFLGPVTVIVPAHNESANIAETVRSLTASDYPEVYVIVVDDGSTDDTSAIVQSLKLPNVRLIRQVNSGKPAALNTGIAYAETDLLVLVDGDTVFAPDAIHKLVQAFADPGVGAVSGNAKVANRRGLLGRWQHLEYVMSFNLDRRMFEIAQCMPTVPGAIGAFRRVALTDVEGVPSDTLAEDTDLTMAIIRAGWKVVYVENAIAWTEAPSKLRQLWRQRYRWCYGTMQSVWKHRWALTERGASGRLGRRGLAYLIFFQLLLPIAAPAVDVYALYGMVFLPWYQVIAVWLGLIVAQTITAAYALKLDRESLRPLWTLPLQQFVYRQLMYLVVVQSAVTALTGVRLRWHRIDRTGEARAGESAPVAVATASRKS